MIYQLKTDMIILNDLELFPGKWKGERMTQYFNKLTKNRKWQLHKWLYAKRYCQ